MGPLGQMALIAFILIVSIVVFCVVSLLIMKCAITHAKIAFALFIAMSINASNPILEGGGFLSYLCWALILVVIAMILGAVPRVNSAFVFSCTVFISYFCMVLVTGLSIAVVSLFSDNPAEIPFAAEMIIKVLCLGVTFTMLLNGSCGIGINIFCNPIIINIERAVASIVYGFGIFFLISSGLGNFPAIADYIIFFGSMAGMFALDVFLTNKIN